MKPRQPLALRVFHPIPCEACDGLGYFDGPLPGTRVKCPFCSKGIEAYKESERQAS